MHAKPANDRSVVSRHSAPELSQRRGIVWFLGLVLLAAVPGCSRSGSDFSAVQARLVEKSGCDWDRQIRIGVPACLFTVARAGLSFVEMEPEARAALQTMRGVRLAIYRCAGGKPNRVAMLEAADSALAERGWDRLVGVLDRHELVAVYAPADLRPGGSLDLCVVVFDGEQLIFVSGRANPEPLVQVALRHAAKEEERLFSHR